MSVDVPFQEQTSCKYFSFSSRFGTVVTPHQGTVDFAVYLGHQRNYSTDPKNYTYSCINTVRLGPCYEI